MAAPVSPCGNARGEVSQPQALSQLADLEALSRRGRRGGFAAVQDVGDQRDLVEQAVALAHFEDVRQGLVDSVSFGE